MHDGLIVPASAEETAKAALRDAGERIVGVRLSLTVGQAQPADGRVGEEAII